MKAKQENKAQMHKQMSIFYKLTPAKIIPTKHDSII